MIKATYKRMFDDVLQDKTLCCLTVSKMEAAQQSRKKFPVFHPITAALALLLTLLSVPVILIQPTYCQLTPDPQSGMAGEKPSLSSSPSIKEEGERVVLANGEVYFNQRETYTQNRFALKEDDRKRLTEREMMDYLGRDPRPDYVPKGLYMDPSGDGDYAIYVRPDGEIYFDNFGFCYRGKQKEPYTSWLWVTAAKGKLPATDIAFLDEGAALSHIGEVDVQVSYQWVELYDGGPQPVGKTQLVYSDFLVDGVGYRVCAQGVPRVEFVQVLASLIEKN